MSNPASQIFGFILKLVIGLSAAILAVGLLLVALVVFALSLLKALITGRKPAPLAAFARFRQFSRAGVWPGNSAPQAAPRAAPGQVVDVEVREILDDRRPS